MKFPIHTDFVFQHPDGIEGKSYNFSSDLDKVGSVWDVSIRNGTGVDVVSEPITIDNAKYGMISLIKIKADVATDYHTIIKEFWVPINCIIESSRHVKDCN
jgi:hypothetical protein